MVCVDTEKLGPIFAGTMADGVGWRSFWWLNVALNLFTLLVLLVGLPETKWHRVSSRELGTVTRESEPPTEKAKSDLRPNVSETSTPPYDQPLTPPELSEPQGSSNKICLGRGRPSIQQWQFFVTSDRPFWTLAQAFCLPWRLLCFPIVQFASFIVGSSSACYLMITFVQSQALASPPYNFSPQSVGFMNFASLAGALIGLLTAGPLSDWVSAKLTRRNRGIREPEMRLAAMVPYVVIMILGNFVMGFGLESHWNWRVRIFPYRVHLRDCLNIHRLSPSSVSAVRVYK